MNECFLKHEIKNFKANNGLKQGTNEAIQQTCLDTIKLSQGRKIKLKEIKQQQKKDFTVSKCVNLILSDDNVALVAWGTKKILSQARGEISLPKLSRKMTIKETYLRYNELVCNNGKDIKSTTFYKVCRSNRLSKGLKGALRRK